MSRLLYNITLLDHSMYIQSNITEHLQINYFISSCSCSTNMALSASSTLTAMSSETVYSIQYLHYNVCVFFATLETGSLCTRWSWQRGRQNLEKKHGKMDQVDAITCLRSIQRDPGEIYLSSWEQSPRGPWCSVFAPGGPFREDNTTERRGTKIAKC